MTKTPVAPLVFLVDEERAALGKEYFCRAAYFYKNC